MEESYRRAILIYLWELSGFGGPTAKMVVANLCSLGANAMDWQGSHVLRLAF